MKKTMVYVGSWGAPSTGSMKSNLGKGEGVYSFELDSDGTLSPVNLAYARDAGIICVSADQKYLYAANESRDFAGLIGSGGGVTAFAIDQKTGGISKINDSISYGACTAYVALSKSGKFLLAANHGSHPDVTCNYVPDGAGSWRLQRGYDDASIAVFRIRDDGGIGKITDLRQFTAHGYFTHGLGQSTSHIHSVNVNDCNLVIGCNRGADRLEIFRLDEDSGKLIELESHSCAQKGLAPRHLAFHPSLPLFYVCNENFPCVTVWTFQTTTNTAEALQTLGTIAPEELEKNPIPILSGDEITDLEKANRVRTHTNSPADIHVHPSGRFLYVSNRHPGSIAIYSIEPENGLLTYICNYQLDDQNPRGFQISPDGNFAVIGLMGSGRVCVFPIDQKTGMLHSCLYEASVPSCCSVRFAML